ncbi:MAG TPA: family 78 glycoside hydrolase catalytic domain, partial [Acidimicrobiia bacterium]
MRLSWKIEASRADRQHSYVVEESATRDFAEITASTGPVVSASQIGVAAPGDPLLSREVRYYRVRVRLGDDWSTWSEPLEVEAGLLEAREWMAKAITIEGDTGAERQSPSPMFRREFILDSDPVRARLHITSLGVHTASINGSPVSDELLAPGWTSYRTRLLAATHDVTDLLRFGPNVVSATLGDGWYRGRLGWQPGNDRCRYGTEVALIAQLEVELAHGGTVTIFTDDDWQAAIGEVLAADLYDGSTVDLRLGMPGWEEPGYDASAWSPVRVVSFDSSTIHPRMTAPVRVVDRWNAEELHAGGGERVFDGKQNIAGYLRMVVEGRAGDQVVVRHSEVLEPDGSLHTRSLRSAQATDEYVLGANAGPTTLQPAFTFHGFRYAGIRTEATIKSAEFVAISSDLPRRSSFECSLPILNRLHENVVWSQRDNFVSVPTDCPQRDERLGWTGDAQA